MKKQINMSNTEYHHIPKLVSSPWRKLAGWKSDKTNRQVFQKCSPDGNILKKCACLLLFSPLSEWSKKPVQKWVRPCKIIHMVPHSFSTCNIIVIDTFDPFCIHGYDSVKQAREKFYTKTMYNPPSCDHFSRHGA